jgi:hypothetical protein
MAAKTAERPQGTLDQVFDGVKPATTADTALVVDERRRSPRRKLSIPVWIRLVSGKSLSPAQARQLLDISPTGLGILSKVPYKPGQRLSVDLCINNTTWSGLMKVVHCTRTAGTYKVGLTVSTELADVKHGPEPGEDNRRRKPGTTVNLKQLQQEILRAMRAYRQARISWNLLGTPIQNKIKRIITRLSPVEDNYQGPAHRRHRRMSASGDVHLVVPTYYGGKWLRARILDISEGGAGLSVPFSLSDDDIERKLAGEFRIAPKVPVIVGIGNEPNTIWLPSEIAYCSRPEDGAIRVGVEFNTPAAQAAFGA